MEKIIFGAYPFSMDEKGRALLPKEVREFWEISPGKKLKITARPDNCLVLLLPEIWQEEVAKFRSEQSKNPARRRYIEAYLRYTREEEVDATNRIMITSLLRNFARIEPGKEVGVITGNFDHFLIMNRDIWDQHENEIKNDAQDRLWEET